MSVQFELDSDWPELLAFLLFLAGFGVAVLSSSFVALYFVCFLAGLLFGKSWSKASEPIALFIVIIGFLLGLLLGLFANIALTIVLLFLGVWLGNWLHKNRVVRSV